MSSFALVCGLAVCFTKASNLPFSCLLLGGREKETEIETKGEGICFVFLVLVKDSESYQTEI